MAEDTYFRIHKEVMQGAQEVNYIFGKRKKKSPCKDKNKNGQWGGGGRAQKWFRGNQTPTSGLLELKKEAGEGHGRPGTSLCCARK